MATNYFPHFYRNLTAGVISLITISLLLTPSLRTPLSSFETLKLSVLQNPQEPQGHLFLAKKYKEVNDLGNAKREILVGLNFAPENKELKSAFGEIENLQNTPQEVSLEIQNWEKIAQDFPGYRDAHLKLSQLYFSIYQNEKAEENLQKALELDPNFKPAWELQKSLEAKRFLGK